MADRISEIKSLLERVSLQLVAELEAQREEIQILKEKVVALEKKVAEELRVVAAPEVTRPEPVDVPEPAAVPKPAAVPEPVAVPGPAVVSEPVAVPEPVAVREPVSAPQSVSAAAPVIVHEPEPEETFFTVTDLNEVHAAPKTMVADLFVERNTIADVAQSKTIPWMVDIPGPTNRSDIVWIDSEMTNEEINSTVKENLFQVYPVGEGSLDEIIGVVFLKDLFGKLDDKDFNISQILKPAQYFYENMEVFKVLEDMKEKHIGYGLICDEFGICQGIVTHKDILEGLVGAINNPEEEPFIIERKSEEGGWLVDGQCPFYDFLAHFEKEEHENSEEEFDFNTIGGLILELLEHIPQSGERVSWKEFDFEVLDMDGARIDKILVKLNQQQSDEDIKCGEEE